MTHIAKAMTRRVKTLWWVGLPAIAIALAGCGSDPGANFTATNVTQQQLPISAATQKIQDAFGLFKAGQFTGARDDFVVVTGDNPTTSERAEALAGEGFCDVRLHGSATGIPEFQQAFNTDSTNQDARVGLAGALISRGAPADISNAVTILQGIDPNNPSFVYTDKFGTGIRNAEVHALLAYADFVSGDQAGANTQKGLAAQLDPNFQNTNVGQILSVISFIP